MEAVAASGPQPHTTNPLKQEVPGNVSLSRHAFRKALCLNNLYILAYFIFIYAHRDVSVCCLRVAERPAVIGWLLVCRLLCEDEP